MDCMALGVYKMKKIIRLVLTVILLINLSACNKDDDYKAPHEQYNEIGKTIITCFENKDTETLISLFSENMKANHDLENEIECAFDLLDSEIVEYGEIHSSVGGGDIREEGYIKREGGGTIEDIITESGTKYIIEFKIRDIDKDNEENVGVMNIWIINQDIGEEYGCAPERFRDIGEQ